MSIKREDLRRLATHNHHGDHTKPVSDADLAALGYVKLEGIDLEALREALHSHWETTSLVYKVARQVLAALDGETT